MSELDSARRVVARARRRLGAAWALEGAVTGLLLGALVAVGLGVLGALGWMEPSGAIALVLPATGTVVGAAFGLRRTPDLGLAALTLDRAAQTDEGLVAALTAVDAPPAFRELAAAHALARIGERRLGEVLPFVAPRRAAPSVVAVGLALALGWPAQSVDAAPSGVPGEQALTTTGAAEAGSDVGESSTGEGTSERADAAAETSSSQLGDRALRAVAEGDPAGERALASLKEGDVAGAAAALGPSDPASTVPTGGAGGSPDGTAAAAENGDRAPEVWSAGRWPLRYDRAVRRWFERAERGTDRAPESGERR